MKPTRYAKRLGFAKKDRGARRRAGQAFLLRHAQKAKTPSGLSLFGEKQGRAVGKLLKKGRNFAFASGNAARTKTTAKGIASGANAKKDVKQYVPFSLDKWFHDEKAYDALVKAKRGNEELVIRDWLDGKVPASIFDKPKDVADPMIKRLHQNLSEAQVAGKNVSVNVTHSDLVEAVFERLTEKKFNLLRPHIMARETEGLRFDFLKSGRIILRYRGKRFDVTKRFNEIISKK